MTELVGKSISHYRILEEIGRGGMGVVYKAEDIKLKRTVAIKFLPKHLSVHGEERERFTQEAQAASALTHPNVATIYEIDEADDETFIVMEYVDGRTLRDRVGAIHVYDPAKGGESPLPLKQVTDIGVQIAEGLAAAHEKGIIHRDVKAENIMMRKDGRVQVMDFGLAKLRGVSKLTKMGSTIGTIAYMSPEQAQGIETDHRTDIFSLGVVLYEILTGQLPFKGAHEAAMMYEIVNVEPLPISSIRSDVEPELARIVMKCLEKDREERYQSVKDVAVDLKHFKRDSAGRRVERKTPPPGTTEMPLASSREPEAVQAIARRRWLMIAAAGILLGSIGVVVWQLMKPSTEISKTMVFQPLQLPFTTIWYPGLSSDGNWLAFPATDANNVTEIYYMHASGGEPRQLTNDSLWKFVADISPDGSQIVYSRGLSRQALSFSLQLFTVSTLGGSSKKIADRGNGARWSPDGHSIAYIERGTTLGIGLWIMNADGSNKHMILEDSLAQRVSLAWSPDAKSIAWLRTFIGSSGFYQEIVIRDLETGKERQLTHEKHNIDEVYWMPQGEILYSSNREGPSNLWAIPSGGGTPVQITRGPGPDLGIKASRDGKRVLYMQQAAYGAVMVADLDGLNNHQITPDDQSVFGSSFSPDGKMIAFVANDPDPIKPSTYLYLVDRDGRNRRKLTASGEIIENYVWSTDGRKIAYTVHVGIEVDSAHQISIIDVTDPSQKTQVGSGRVIQWLRDGSLNILSNATSWRAPVQGGQRERIYEDSTVVFQSPDGLKLITVDARPDRTSLSLKVQNKPTRRLYQGSVDRGRGSFKWLPDSKSFVFSKSGELWTMSIESGKMQRYLWKNTEAIAFDDISPDGKQTVYVKQRMNAKLILIDNFH